MKHGSMKHEGLSRGANEWVNEIIKHVNRMIIRRITKTRSQERRLTDNILAWTL